MIPRLWHNPRFWEFVRYSIVGASSTAIDFGVLALLTDVGTWHPLAANPIAFLLGLTNGFFWNRHWTFKHAKEQEPAAQYVRFALVNLGGVLIDQAILAAALWLGPEMGFPPDLAKWAGKVAAIPFVVVWNFTANSRWTFRPLPAAPDRERPVPETGPLPRP